ncbi:MAG: Rnase Y domain-containing protein, partial [Patescibacteria group bacterium]
MTTATVLLVAGATTIVGLVIGYYLRFVVSLGKKGSMELTIKQTMLEANTEAQKVVSEAEKKAAALIQESKEEAKEREAQMKKLEDRLIKKDETIDKRQLDVEREAENIKEKIVEVKELKNKVKELEVKAESELERISRLSQEQARNELIADIEKKSSEDFLMRMQKLERDGVEKLDRKAKDILATSIQRLASSSAPDIMTTMDQIPSDDIKGKIIGKEGRNIRALERAAGVEIIIDDTPGAITISGFDPVRRHIAKFALEALIADGRIQPAKIEETVEK